MIRKLSVVAFALVFSLLAVACGGGGGGGGGGASKKISGTAAAGGPIVGLVTIQDSSVPPRQKFADIDADGSYTVNVDGLTAPYALRAQGEVGGRRYVLYSAATAADVNGNVNITPFTDLIIANIAQSIAETYFTSGDYTGLTPAELEAANSNLTDLLTPILSGVGLSTSLDLLRYSFNADHTGLDGILDLVQVNVNPDTLTAELVNLANNNNTVAVNLTNGAVEGSFTGADGTAINSGMTDVQQIAAGMETFSNLFHSSVPSPTNPTLLALFDEANFRFNGIGLNAFLTQITTDSNIIGVTFGNIRIVGFSNGGDTCAVAFETSLDGRTLRDAPNLFYFNKIGGIWKNAGNQRVGAVYTEVRSYYYPGNPVQSFYETGINFQIRDDGGVGIDHAIITGPGLPVEGIKYVRDIQFDHFVWENGETGRDLYEMTDDQIDQIPLLNAEYTITLYNEADEQMDAPYVQTIGGRPYKISELTPALFPTITQPTVTSLGNWAGGNLTIRWTLPTGTIADYAYLRLDGPNGSAQAETGMLATTATQATLNIPGAEFPSPLFMKNINVGVDDADYRVMTSVLFWQP